MDFFLQVRICNSLSSTSCAQHLVESRCGSSGRRGEFCTVGQGEGGGSRKEKKQEFGASE